MKIRREWWCGGVAALALLVAGAGPAPAAEEKTVAEEILDILRDEGRISSNEHERLTRRAQEEQTARARPAVSASSEWDTYWKNGLTIENKSKGIKVTTGGRLMFDAADFDSDTDLADGLGESDLKGGSGTEVRRARVFFKGTLWERMGFKLNFDFADGETEIKDAYLRFLEIPHAQQVTVGHFKEPFSLEELHSSKYLTFIERSVLNALAPSRNMGVAIGGPILDQRATWAAGAFRQTDGVGATFDDDEIWNLTGRVTGVPYWEDEGAKMVHLGAGYVFTQSGGELRFRARPGAHLSPARFVDTTAFEADGAHRFGGELAANWGPLHFQSEAALTLVDSDVGDDPEFFGGYAQVSYFLTGEHRPYKLGAGEFSRVKPKQNFGSLGGSGAWEIALRQGYLSLNDGFVNGGRMTQTPAGVNWYVNPNVRMMFNYVHADVQSGPRGIGLVPPDPKFDGSSDIFVARMQVDF